VKNAPSGTFRIIELMHNFSTCARGGGYTCGITLAALEAGQVGEVMTGPQAIARRFRDLAGDVGRQRPAIDIGQVTAYVSKHRATLNYGQSPSLNEATPSVDVKVDEIPQLQAQAIASPFAWQKCGLIVPVYSGMRALLAHNLGLVNDAVIAGFLWSDVKDAAFERPKNEEGDYWLCLPTKVDESTKQPAGKGVNDLTDRTGLRVIQARGLQIFVGDDALPQVGERPTVPKEKTIVIEHESGTQITIGDDGAVKIDTSNSQKEISFTNGSVTLKLGSSGVEVS
jgi:hypothetical protein